MSSSRIGTTNILVAFICILGVVAIFKLAVREANEKSFEVTPSLVESLRRNRQKQNDVEAKLTADVKARLKADAAIEEHNSSNPETTLSLAEQGNASAQFNLGVKYYNGEGVPQDYKAAVKWYSLAAEQGLDKAQSNLGVMYNNGEGVIQDNVDSSNSQNRPKSKFQFHSYCRCD